jgi:peroxisomal 3,2-trans-enoyl-CoA isomerase
MQKFTFDSLPDPNHLPTSDPNLIIETRDTHILSITLNNTKTKNSITQTMYLTLIATFRNANKNDDIKVVTITGNGDFFSSGNDLRPLSQLAEFADKNDQESIQKWTRINGSYYAQFVQSIYNCEKVCVALVNGPCVGIACTMLPLFDFVYCNDKATFHTPFMSLGLAPEGQSSLTFPILIGRQKASEFLLLGKRFSAKEAKKIKFVNDVFPASEFKSRTDKIINTLAGYDLDALRNAKKLIVDHLYGGKKVMDQVCEVETEYLKRSWASETSIDAIKMFMAIKMQSKL